MLVSSPAIIAGVLGVDAVVSSQRQCACWRAACKEQLVGSGADSRLSFSPQATMPRSERVHMVYVLSAPSAACIRCTCTAATWGSWLNPHDCHEQDVGRGTAGGKRAVGSAGAPSRL